MDTDTGMIPSSPSTETSRSSSDIATEVRLAKVFFPLLEPLSFCACEESWEG
jgi:hypothetical protein